jgi:hypothetical protein
MHSAVVALRGGSNISGLKALRADVLRRAVSQLSWLRATFRDAIRGGAGNLNIAISGTLCEINPG